jgi:hypothetical protein
MEAIFYIFDKKTNSTMKPEAAGSTPYVNEILVKDTANLMSPNIEWVSYDADNFLKSPFNYVYIPSFRRYYFIENWSMGSHSQNGTIFHASTSVDLLATYASQIFLSTQYVVRNSTLYDDNLIDNTYTSRAGALVSASVLQGQGFDSTFDGGGFVVGTVGNNGLTNHILLGREGLDNLFSTLYSGVDWAGITTEELSSGITRLLFNPAQYVTSVKWFPQNPLSTEVQTLDKLYLGWWDTTIRNVPKLWTGMRHSSTYTAQIPKHPQSSMYGAYLNSAPHSKYYLIFPPFGTIPIDSQLLYNNTSITIHLLVDYFSGQAALSSDLFPQTYTAEMGIDFGLYGVSGDKTGYTSIAAAIEGGIQAVSGTAKTVSNAATNEIAVPIAKFFGNLNNILGITQLSGVDIAGEAEKFQAESNEKIAEYSAEAESGLKNSITNALAAFQSQAFTTTPARSAGIYAIPPNLAAIFAQSTEPSAYAYGKPLMRAVPLFSCSGFTSVDKPQVPIPGTRAERRSLEKIMAQGFYLEGMDYDPGGGVG